MQCRPLKKVKNNIDDNLFYDALKNIEIKFSNLQKSPSSIPGKFTIFSNMSDWNPAEMIGVKPTLLSLSLYSELIMITFGQNKEKHSYQDVKPNPLMVNFLGMSIYRFKSRF